MYQGTIDGELVASWPGLVAFIACLVLIALLVVLIARIDRPWEHLLDHGERTLDARFARGEIDRQTYFERRALLR